MNQRKEKKIAIFLDSFKQDTEFIRYCDYLKMNRRH